MKAKRKRLIILILILILIIAGGSSFYFLKNKVHKKYVQLESGVSTPNNLSKCPKEFYEKSADGTMKIPFNKYPNEDVCLYYQIVKNDTAQTINQQYNNVVTACRLFEANGKKIIDKETSYILIGYEKKPCTQGTYKQ